LRRLLKLILPLIILLVIISGYLIIVNLVLVIQMRGLKSNQEKEFKHKSEQERKAIINEFEQKTREGLAAYEAGYQRLEIEKQRTKELENKAMELKRIRQRTN